MFVGRFFLCAREYLAISIHSSLLNSLDACVSIMTKKHLKKGVKKIVETSCVLNMRRRWQISVVTLVQCTKIVTDYFNVICSLQCDSFTFTKLTYAHIMHVTLKFFTATCFGGTPPSAGSLYTNSLRYNIQYIAIVMHYISVSFKCRCIDSLKMVEFHRNMWE
jgi:hypothetical protein